MADDPRVEALVEELLNSRGDAEEVCRGCPELLPQVRAEWQRVREIQTELTVLFPDSASPDDSIPPIASVSQLPKIADHQVLEVLGYGGMGVVYKAWHLRLHRPVAVKMLLAGPFARQKELERFVREAQAAAGLNHPNIVQIYEVGNVEGRPYFTMEFVEGGSLAQKLAGVPQPVREAAALTSTLAETVQVAHQRGIIHRDLKPANVLLTVEGIPKIADFGLARRMEDAAAATQSGAPLGTPSYMAPEQAGGKTSAIGPAVDVYALGAILYEQLTGRPPFRGESGAETVQQVLLREPVPPSRLNPAVQRDLEIICLKCLRKEPENRYASATALSNDLTCFLEGRPIQARPLGWAARFERWCRRNPMAAAFCLVLLVLAVISTWQAARANSANAQAQKRLKQIEKANDLLGSIFESLDPNEVAGADRPLRAILVGKLDRAVEQLEGESIGDPLVVAKMQDRFAVSLWALAEPGKAIVLDEKALATRQATLGPDDPLTLGTRYNLAMDLKAAGNLDRALPLQEETLRRMTAVHGPDHRSTLSCMNSLAGMYELAGRRDLCLPLLEETLRRRKPRSGAKIRKRSRLLSISAQSMPILGSRTWPYRCSSRRSRFRSPNSAMPTPERSAR